MVELKRFKKIDFVIMAVSALIWVSVNYLLADSFYTLLLITAFLMTFIVLLIRKGACPVLIFTVGGALIMILNNLGIPTLPSQFIISLMLMGLFFELINFFTKWNYIYIVLASAFSAATIPGTSLLITNVAVRGLEMNILNFALACFFIAALGSIIALIIWRYTKSTKFIIRIRYGFK